MECIYLDNNATTPMLPAVWEAMRPVAVEAFGNAASAHGIGRRARQALEDARERVAAILDAFPDEVIFTSGATEANNLALLGTTGQHARVRGQGSGGSSQESGVRTQESAGKNRIVTSPIEHPSVVEPIQQLENWGWVVDRAPVNHLGVIRTDVYQNLLQQETELVSIMLANNETGALQPIRDLATILQGRARFHCDAVQAVGKLPVRFHELGVTSLSLSAHKFHGPKGVGVLLLRRGIKLRRLIHGGHQQRGRRPGT
jgi:cysteine desulfurase